MAELTRVDINGASVTDNDVQKYQLTGACTSKGELPSINVFVLEIVDPANPDDDVLTRVAKPYDFDPTVGYKTNRDQAVFNDETYWRSATFAKYYDDVEVADAARTTLKDEVNDLANNYATYDESFATSETYTFPTSESSATQALKDSYDASYTAYTTAVTAAETADDAVTEAQAAYDDAQYWDGQHSLLETALVTRSVEMTAGRDYFRDLLGTGDAGVANPVDAEWFVAKAETFIASADDTAEKVTFVGQKETFDAELVSQRASKLPTAETGVSNHTSMSAATYIPATKRDTTTTSATLTSAQTAKVTADADVSAKYTAMEAAYNAAKTVCPDWVPDSPLPARP